WARSAPPLRPRDPRLADQLSPGDHPGPVARRLGALPGLEPRPQRDPPEAPRVEHPPERPVLHQLPRRDPPRHGDRAAALLLEGLGADREGNRALAARPWDRSE